MKLFIVTLRNVTPSPFARLPHRLCSCTFECERSDLVLPAPASFLLHLWSIISSLRAGQAERLLVIHWFLRGCTACMLMSNLIRWKAVNSGVFSNYCDATIDPSTSAVFLCGFCVKSHVGIKLICKTWLSHSLWHMFLHIRLFLLQFVDEYCLRLKGTVAVWSANVFLDFAILELRRLNKVLIWVLLNITCGKPSSDNLVLDGFVKILRS